MLIGIYTNPDRDSELITTKKLTDILRRNTLPFVVHDSLSAYMGAEVRYFGDDCAPKPDVLFVLGGDGTILSAVNFAAGKSVPVLGVNLGNVGFLSVCGVDKLEDTVSAIKNGNYSLSERTMLEADAGGRTIFALNEIAFYKKNIGKTVTITVKVGGSVLSNFKSDGFIVSTPTGSTAYALSSGGPIVSPNVRCSLLVPINCHHMSSKPVIIDEYETVEIYGDEPAYVIADGRVEDSDSSGITVRKSGVKATFVVLNKNNFYIRLHEKLAGHIKEEK